MSDLLILSPYFALILFSYKLCENIEDIFAKCNKSIINNFEQSIKNFAYSIISYDFDWYDETEDKIILQKTSDLKNSYVESFSDLHNAYNINRFMLSIRILIIFIIPFFVFVSFLYTKYFSHTYYYLRIMDDIPLILLFVTLFFVFILFSKKSKLKNINDKYPKGGNDK